MEVWLWDQPGLGVGTISSDWASDSVGMKIILVAFLVFWFFFSCYNKVNAWHSWEFRPVQINRAANTGQMNDSSLYFALSCCGELAHVVMQHLCPINFCSCCWELSCVVGNCCCSGSVCMGTVRQADKVYALALHGPL